MRLPTQFVCLKRAIKGTVQLAALTLMAPLALPELLVRRLCGHDVFFETQSEIVALLPGKTGTLLRAAFYHWTLRSCPMDVAIHFGTVFGHSSAVLGHRVYIGARCCLGRVVIGNDCMLANHVQVLSGRHQHGMSAGSLSFQEQERQFETVTVGANCWLGAGSIIMAAVEYDSIIGAGSVVTRPIPSNSVAVGSPARVIRSTATTAPPPPRVTELHPLSRLAAEPAELAASGQAPEIPPMRRTQ